MKTFRMIGMALMAVLMCVNFASCSEDEDAISKIEIIEGTKLDVFIEDSNQLHAKHYPEYLDAPNYSWSSSNSSVIEIDSYTGEYVAKSLGTSIITVTASGLELNAQCNITVLPIEATNITISPTSKEMFIGDELALTATITPENVTYKEIQWSSSDSNIATVNNEGKVTAVKEGVCSIYAKTRNNKTAECTVIINPICVQYINLDIKEKTLEVGKDFTLTATITPDNATYKEIQWSSSDSNIATVNNKGKVTAIKEGECYIYAKTGNDLTAECKIVVKPASVQKVEFNESIIKLLVGETKTVKYSVTPYYAKISEIKWSVEDESIASVLDNGTVTCKKAGRTKLFVTINGVHVAECQINGCNIEEFISLRFGSLSTVIIPGYTASSLECYISNESSQDIVAKSIQLIDSATGYKGNVMDLENEIVKSYSSIGRTITIKNRDFNNIIFRWTYIYNGKEYTKDIKY